jgi:hypothetical protein
VEKKNPVEVVRPKAPGECEKQMWLFLSNGFHQFYFICSHHSWILGQKGELSSCAGRTASRKQDEEAHKGKDLFKPRVGECYCYCYYFIRFSTFPWLCNLDLGISLNTL